MTIEAIEAALKLMIILSILTVTRHETRPAAHSLQRLWFGLYMRAGQGALAPSYSMRTVVSLESLHKVFDWHGRTRVRP